MPMQTVQDPLSLFVDCARRLAFARCLPDAERKGAGVVLELNRSQFARDGLAAASRAFAQSVQQRALTQEEARSLASSIASRAPTDVWWRPVYVTLRPDNLDRDDTWLSLEEVRAIAEAVGALRSEPAHGLA